MNNFYILSNKNLEEINSLALTKPYLNYEFLLWVWYAAENFGSNLQVHHPQYSAPICFSLWMDDRVLLQPTQDQGHESLLKGGQPCQSLEAGLALSDNRRIKELKFGVTIDGWGDFSATISAKDITPKGITPPPFAEDEENTQSIAQTRLAQLNCFLVVFDGIFSLFLKDRAQDSFHETTQKSIRNWMLTRAQRQTLPTDS